MNAGKRKHEKPGTCLRYYPGTALRSVPGSLLPSAVFYVLDNAAPFPDNFTHVTHIAEHPKHRHYRPYRRWTVILKRGYRTRLLQLAFQLVQVADLVSSNLFQILFPRCTIWAFGTVKSPS